MNNSPKADYVFANPLLIVSQCHSKELPYDDYKLTPGIYVGTEAEEDDGIPFEEKMAGLKTKLNEQFEKSNELQKRIIKNLNEI